MRSPGPVHDSAALSLDLQKRTRALSASRRRRVRVTPPHATPRRCATRKALDLLVIVTVGGSRLT